MATEDTKYKTRGNTLIHGWRPLSAKGEVADTFLPLANHAISANLWGQHKDGDAGIKNGPKHPLWNRQGANTIICATPPLSDPIHLRIVRT